MAQYPTADLRRAASPSKCLKTQAKKGLTRRNAPWYTPLMVNKPTNQDRLQGPVNVERARQNEIFRAILRSESIESIQEAFNISEQSLMEILTSRLSEIREERIRLNVLLNGLDETE